MDTNSHRIPPVAALPPLYMVNNVMCIDLIDSEEEISKSDTVEEGTITPVRIKGDTESPSHCQVFSVNDDSPTIDINLHENASLPMQPLVIEVSDSKEESEEESNCNRGTIEPMSLLQPMFDVEDRSELEAIGFKCKYCHRILLKKEDLKKEYQMHTRKKRALRDKLFPCSRCKKTFSSRFDFEWHDAECPPKLKRNSNRTTRQCRKMQKKVNKFVQKI